MAAQSRFAVFGTNAMARADTWYRQSPEWAAANDYQYTPVRYINATG